MPFALLSTIMISKVGPVGEAWAIQERIALSSNSLRSTVQMTIEMSGTAAMRYVPLGDLRGEKASIGRQCVLHISHSALPREMIHALPVGFKVRQIEGMGAVPSIRERARAWGGMPGLLRALPGGMP
mgnify:CR=1 FL=1